MKFDTMNKLSSKEIKDKLSKLREWKISGGNKIRKIFEFKDFNEAMRFVNKIAVEAEKANHHPDIIISYNKVTLTLSSHDAGGLTLKDFILAQEIESLHYK